MSEISKLAQELANLAVSATQNASTHQATVLRTDNDGTIWVSIDGGADETPCVSTYADAKPGDTVKVEIANGRATILGNATSPAATSRTVEVVMGVAEDADDKAGRAMDAADVAEQSAINALQSANIAATAASEAQGSAEQAVQDAATASEQAQAAQNSATQANSYAIGALSGLSDVEKVVGTLNWISEHGVYSPTTDNVVQADKSYYTYDGTDYVPVQEPTQDGLYSYALTSDTAIDPEKTYYTRNVEYAYFLTHDTEIVEGKTYYALDEETGEYEEVEEPDVADIATYYERTEHISYEVVGKNLLKNSANPTSDDVAVYTGEIVGDGTIKLEPTDEARACAKWKVDYLDYADYAGDTYTFSFDAKLTDDETAYTNDIVRLRIAVNKASRVPYGINVSHDAYYITSASDVENKVGADWKTYALTCRVPEDLVSGVQETLSAGNYLTADAYSPPATKPMLVKNLKLERGEKATSADIAEYYERSIAYYELGIDVSIQNYIASHLSLTNEGLNLTADSSMYRAVLGVDGLKILDPQGKVVGVHGQTIQLGATDGAYFEATSSRLAFRTSDQDIAWFGQNSDGIWEMHIQNTYAEDMVRFGNYAFIKRDNGNMSLKWLGDDS